MSLISIFITFTAESSENGGSRARHRVEAGTVSGTKEKLSFISLKKKKVIVIVTQNLNLPMLTFPCDVFSFYANSSTLLTSHLHLKRESRDIPHSPSSSSSGLSTEFQKLPCVAPPSSHKEPPSVEKSSHGGLPAGVLKVKTPRPCATGR